MSDKVEILDGASGDFADMLQGGRPFGAYADDPNKVYLRLKRNNLHVNSQLRKDEWEELDREVMRAVRHELRFVNDLKAAGLTHKVGLGTLVSMWNRASRMGPASISMTGQSVGERDRLDYDAEGSPIPVIFKEFTIGRRQLEAARRLGEALDLTHVYEASRSVAETIEDICINGSSVSFQGKSIQGLRTATNRLADTVTNFGGGTWSTETNIVPTVKGMIGALQAKHFYGPYTLYVSQNQYNESALSFFSDGSGDRPADRLRKIGVTDVRNVPAELLPDGELVLVQMARNVVDWAEAMDIQAIEWMTEDQMTINFRLMAVAAPRIKTATNGVTGIAHATGAQ